MPLPNPGQAVESKDYLVGMKGCATAAMLDRGRAIMATEKREQTIPQGFQADLQFMTILRSHLERQGFEIVTPVGQVGFAIDVALAKGHHISIVGSRASDRSSIDRTLNTVRSVMQEREEIPATEIVVVRSAFRSHGERGRLTDTYGVPVISLNEVVSYLTYRREMHKSWKRPFKGSSIGRIKANADSILLASVSLQYQITAKIEDLGRQRPNSDDGIAAKHAALSDYKELLERVVALEQATAKLLGGSAKPATVAKVGNAFGRVFKKWWEKSGPKVLDKSADVAILAGGTSILILMGVDPTWAATITGTIVTGKILTRR
jgi:hypothetical protein